jgi:hypothetical protein
MKVKHVGIPILLAVSVGVVNAATTDFAGTWVLNKAKSAGELRSVVETMIVAVDAKQLMCDANGEKADRSTFRLDGKKTTWQLEKGKTIKRFTGELRVLENGEALELTRHVEYFGLVPITGTMIKKTVKLDTPLETLREVWTLQDQGKVLLVKSDDGTSLVYERQDKT